MISDHLGTQVPSQVQVMRCVLFSFFGFRQLFFSPTCCHFFKGIVLTTVPIQMAGLWCSFFPPSWATVFDSESRTVRPGSAAGCCLLKYSVVALALVGEVFGVLGKLGCYLGHKFVGWVHWTWGCICRRLCRVIGALDGCIGWVHWMGAFSWIGALDVDTGRTHSTDHGSFVRSSLPPSQQHGLSRGGNVKSLSMATNIPDNWY